MKPRVMLEDFDHSSVDSSVVLLLQSLRHHDELDLCSSLLTAPLTWLRLAARSLDVVAALAVH